MNNVTSQSYELKQFYLAYLAWVQDGAPEDNLHGFTRCFGLCTNLTAYLSSNEGYIFQSEMEWQFQKNGLYPSYPFGMTDYTLRTRNHSLHECPKRLAWVCMMVNVPEED